MKFKYLLILCVVTCYGQFTFAEQESKYNEIVKLLSQTDQLQSAAQTYTASVADPNDYSSQGYSRSSDRSRSQSPSSKYQKDEDDAKKLAEEEEEERKPDRLALLLAESKFTCQGQKNGYYADESVGCQVFHYCVDEVKHSWQCPENTVFHQIHLNCVPDAQDICSQSSQYHVVNDYLHKELEERGPNNTILYSQRFYPEGFDLGGGDTVTQIFQAQAQAALLAKQERARSQSQSDNSGNSGNGRQYNSYNDEPAEPPRARARPKNYNYNNPSTQSVRSQQVANNKPVYKQPQQVSRPLIIPPTYTPSSQPIPTKRPTVSYTTPEVYTSPTYTESNQDIYSPSSVSSSSGANQNYQPANLGSSNFNSVGSSYSQSSPSQYSPPSHSTPSHSTSGHSPSSHSSQSSQSFRPQSRPSSYPTRSLGIPIASFRVAPSNSGYSGAAAAASTIREVNVAPYYNGQPISGYYF